MGNSRFIAVMHQWHVSSNGFKVFELKSKTKQDAQDEANALAFKHSGTFNSTAVKVIELQPGERIRRPEKLTWLERISGYTREKIHGRRLHRVDR